MKDLLHIHHIIQMQKDELFLNFISLIFIFQNKMEFNLQ